ncbi:hypothetical protein BSKO_05287 [Bryopsis sp. KO-2023]|nr:hypothetical protein BSKO_05287 [Bryopsis sp. KO-2023]
MDLSNLPRGAGTRRGGKSGKGAKIGKSAAAPEPAAQPAVWQPGDPLEEGEELDFDPTAYDFLDRFTTEWPCLSFDFAMDGLGSGRTDFPHTVFMVGGTQAENSGDNYLTLMKLANLNRLNKPKGEGSKMETETDAMEEDESSDSEEEEDSSDEEVEESGASVMHYRRVRHFTGVNRIRSMPQKSTMVAAWGERGNVQVFDMEAQMKDLVEEDVPILKVANKILNKKAIFAHKHATEGFALDWSGVVEGQLASGDCRKNLHVWSPTEGGWNVSNPLRGHTKSVEDIQWSPSEATVLASGSVDKSIKIWDTRNSKGAMISVNAHETDVNVITWSPLVTYMLASGGDDGNMKIWDLRNFKEEAHVAQFKFHKEAVTSIEWSPHEGSMLASSGADDQLVVWDLALERDPEEEVQLGPKTNAQVPEDLPPQVLFLHGGQSNIKELHWHKQIPGVIGSTASDGFNIFKAANV